MILHPDYQGLRFGMSVFRRSVFLLNWPITLFLTERLCSYQFAPKRIHKFKLSDVEENIHGANLERKNTFQNK
jgi:hypothetical protein